MSATASGPMSGSLAQLPQAAQSCLSLIHSDSDLDSVAAPTAALVLPVADAQDELRGFENETTVHHDSDSAALPSHT